jgi:hypothetical protein
MRTDRGRSAAQWFCLIIGGTLVLAGLLGFIVEPTFDTSAAGDPGALDGEKLILFEVNGWHNVVHIASGLFLVVFAGRHRTARMAALAFGAIYAVVTVVGLVDGHDVVGLIPVNPADNVLHILLTVAALAAGIASDRDRREGRPARGGRRFARESTESSPTLQRR